MTTTLRMRSITCASLFPRRSRLRPRATPRRAGGRLNGRLETNLPLRDARRAARSLRCGVSEPHGTLMCCRQTDAGSLSCRIRSNCAPRMRLVRPPRSV